MILDYKNLKFKHLIKDMTIDLWFSEKFANIKDIKKKCYSMMNLLKFTYNKKELNYNQICNKILSILNYLCKLNVASKTDSTHCTTQLSFYM